MSNAPSNSNYISSDGQGVIVGLDPANPQPAVVQQLRPDQAVSQPIQVTDLPPQQQAVTNARFTAEDIERARQQEKEKLYPRIDEMQQQLRQLAEERQAEQAERTRLAEEAEALRRAEEEKDMEIKDLMARRESEFQAQIDQLNQRYETDRAVFERERTLHEAQQYRLQRIEQESEFILPELRDLIRGDTPEQVDASIEEMKLRSEAIFNNMTAAQQPQPFRGVAMPSVPPVGPMEQMPSYESLSAEDIRTMSMDDYKRHREQLLRASSQQRRGR
jgi:DNA repair exonuclease SbcCD ATPase subunit